MLDSGVRLAAAFLPVGVPVLVGLVVAVLRRRVLPGVAGPAIAGLALQLVVVITTTFLVAAAALGAFGLRPETLLRLSSVLGFAVIVLQVVSWTLLLVALFRRLPARRGVGDRQDRTPTGRHALLDPHGEQVVAEEGTTLLPVGAALAGAGAGAGLGAGLGDAAVDEPTESPLPSLPVSDAGASPSPEPLDEEPALDEPPVDEEPVDEEPVDEEPVDEEDAAVTETFAAEPVVTEQVPAPVEPPDDPDEIDERDVVDDQPAAGSTPDEPADETTEHPVLLEETEPSGTEASTPDEPAAHDAEIATEPAEPEADDPEADDGAADDVPGEVPGEVPADDVRADDVEAGADTPDGDTEAGGHPWFDPDGEAEQGAAQEAGVSRAGSNEGR